MMSRSIKKYSYLFVASIVTLVAAAAVLFRIYSPGEPPDLSRYPVRGIDVSAHNGKIDFDAVAADSISFVYIKATEGAGFCDARFHINYYAARRAGLKVGAYHFFRFDRPGDMQAINLLHAIRGMELDLPIAIDVEEWTNPSDVSPLAVSNSLSDMIDYLTRRGHKLVLYSNKNDYERFLRPRFEGHALWICSFTEPDTASIRWTFWQHSHSGRVSGIKGPVDLNVFQGNSFP